MPPLQVVLHGLPGVLQLVLLLFVPALALVVRRKWRLAAARREEVRRLVLLAAEEAARAEIEAAYEYSSRLDEHSLPSTAVLSAATAPGPIAKPVCAVCYSPTTTRCSRCKAVRYCSGKCQIMHWRQGHKEECHPPNVDIQPNTQESSSDLRTPEIESSNLCDSDLVTLDANSNQTTHQERPASSNSSGIPTIPSGEENLKAKHIVDTSGTKCSPGSSSLTPPSNQSTFTAPTEDGACTHDSSAQYNPARCQGSGATADVSHTATSEMKERKLNKSSSSECIGVKHSISNLSSLNKLNGKASDCGTEEVGCQSSSSLRPNFSNMNDCIISKSTVDHAECQERTSEFGGDQFSGHTDCTKFRVATEEVSHCQNCGTAVQLSTNANSSCQVVPTMPKQVHDNLSENSVSKVRDASTGGFDVSTANFRRDNNTEVLPRARETISVPSSASVDNKSSGGSGYSDSRTASLKAANTSSVQNGLLGMTNSVSNGSYDLKTSVQRVVQQFKPSKVSKNYQQMFFPYDIFVKLYNEKVEMRPSGLMNCGNSCYANVVLQCLAFTRPLTSYLVQGLHTKSCPKKEWCFTCEFESLVLKAKQGQSPLSPISIISQIHSIGSHLGHGREEDAHEFLRYAIDAMQSICLKEGGPHSTSQFAEETTLIQLTFGGYLRSKIKCMRCQSKSERNERMMDLTVEIHGDVGTLDEALGRFTMTESLDGENKYQCGRCKSYVKAKKRLKVLEAPNILTIVLKRFQSGKFGKLNKAVRFPQFLNLAKYMSGTSDKSPIYRLYAVVVHLDVMNAAFSGHYVCYVMNATGKWYKIDDSTVKPVEFERVQSKSAYMLFYARCSPRAPSLIRTTMINDKGKIRSKGQDAVSSVARPRPQNYPNWTGGNPWRMSMWDSSDTSDSSSLLSCSDEGSCSTESTRDSTSTEGISEYIFGESGHWSSPMRFSEDSDGSTHSPMFSGRSYEAIYNGHLPDSPESGYSASDFSFSGLEDSFRMRGLSYSDCVEVGDTDTVAMMHNRDNREVSVDGVSFLRSDIRSLRKLTKQCSSSSSSSSSHRKDTDHANPFNHKSVLSRSNSNRDRTTQTFR